MGRAVRVTILYSFDPNIIQYDLPALVKFLQLL